MPATIAALIAQNEFHCTIIPTLLYAMVEAITQGTLQVERFVTSITHFRVTIDKVHRLQEAWNQA